MRRLVQDVVDKQDTAGIVLSGIGHDRRCHLITDMEEPYVLLLDVGRDPHLRKIGDDHQDLRWIVLELPGYHTDGRHASRDRSAYDERLSDAHTVRAGAVHPELRYRIAELAPSYVQVAFRFLQIATYTDIVRQQILLATMFDVGHVAFVKRR